MKSHILQIRDLLPITLATGLWAKHCILFRSDNQAAVYDINKKSSKVKTLMKLVRRQFGKCLQFNMLFQAEHIAGLHYI